MEIARCPAEAEYDTQPVWDCCRSGVVPHADSSDSRQACTLPLSWCPTMLMMLPYYLLRYFWINFILNNAILTNRIGACNF
jgi:hypothetical protein